MPEGTDCCGSRECPGTTGGICDCRVVENKCETSGHRQPSG